jgi:phosphoribosyl 1,2-cyclic phosphate phosphodiesterase
MAPTPPMTVRILGCGTSGGVPRVGNQWGQCDPTNPRNRRRRVSVLVRVGDVRLVIDTSPDFREQMLDAGVDRLDAVLYTHDHADHTHGIDDVRGLFHLSGRPIPAYMDERTFCVLHKRFDYVFDGGDGYPATLAAQLIDGPFQAAGVNVTPFRQIHGPIHSLGFRIGGFAYSTDLNGIPEESTAALEGLDLWVVDALRYEPHPTHAHLAMTLGWIERFKPKRAILTHMDKDMDYGALLKQLPAGVEPAFDGLEITLFQSDNVTS